ncbi:unnamed protein product [Paramecium sonneborni]|uniref:EF-hand domain-containing protein n=1 Tax=Paramecium sonneborni TaxID=65129 RepID=A0A8S1P7X5_9CILI|nr:unnamed protein product [Paramecium sonneborni]
MLQQHPYLNQPENITNKYNKPINLSQQLSFSQSLPGQSTQQEQNYATPQWQKQMHPQFSNQQPQIQTIQSKYIAQPQTVQIVYQTQPTYVQQPQQQIVPVVYNAQQQQLRQSSPPRIIKINQQLQPDYKQPEVQIPEYYPPPPPIYYDEPIHYEEPIFYPPPLKTIKLPPQNTNNYYQPNQVSYIQNFDNRPRYPEYPFKSMDLMDYFNKALIDMATQEEKIEKAKVQVFSQQDFRVDTLFSEFDKNSTQQLSLEEILNGFKAYSLQPEFVDIKLLFEEFGQQDMINREQFINMITPQTVLKFSLAFQQDQVRLLPETKQLIRYLFVCLLNAESVYEAIRQDLISKQKEFDRQLNYDQIYNEIFSNNQPNNLRSYIQNLGHYFDVAVINALFNRFAKDSTKGLAEQLQLAFQPKLQEEDCQL